MGNAQFTLTELVDGSTLIEGTDVRGTTGSQIVFASAWAELKRKGEVDQAVAGVDAAIAKLVAPITEALDQLNTVRTTPALDPLAYVELEPEVEHVRGQQRQLVKLDSGSILVRAIEEGAVDRLIWVRDELTLIKAQAAGATAAPAEADTTD